MRALLIAVYQYFFQFSILYTFLSTFRINKLYYVSYVRMSFTRCIFQCCQGCMRMHIAESMRLATSLGNSRYGIKSLRRNHFTHFVVHTHVGLVVKKSMDHPCYYLICILTLTLTTNHCVIVYVHTYLVDE